MAGPWCELRRTIPFTSIVQPAQPRAGATPLFFLTTATLRYPVGGTVSINRTLQTNVLDQNDILSIVHAAAVKLSIQSGYSNIVHVFLPRGIDTCFDLTSICYSPDNPSSFFFCAYHGAVVFNDIGHILFSVEPYQNVPGCQVATPTPNGDLVDSTASVLSHEFFETITDPDLDAWWSEASLIERGAEIGDICEPIVNGSAQFLHEHLKSGHTFRRNVQDIDSSGRVSSLSQHGECLEGREETANHSVGTTGMVSAKDPRGHASASRDHQRLSARRRGGNMAAGKMETRR